MVSGGSRRKFRFVRIHQTAPRFWQTEKAACNLKHTGKGRERDRACLVAGRRYDGKSLETGGAWTDRFHGNMWSTIAKEFKRWQTGRLPQKPLNLTPVFACRVIIGDEKQKKKKSESWKLIWNAFIWCRAEKAKSVLKSLHAAPAATLLRNRVKYEQPAEREQQVLWEKRCGGVSRPSAQGHTEPAGWSSCPCPPAPPPSCLDVSGLPARETHYIISKRAHS